jgi:SsrA-binding protein
VDVQRPHRALCLRQHAQPRVQEVRKLFLHRGDIRKIELALNAGGKALIPLRMYFKGALVKVEVALCIGKKLFDKREDLKKKAQMREVNKAIRDRRP